MVKGYMQTSRTAQPFLMKKRLLLSLGTLIIIGVVLWARHAIWKLDHVLLSTLPSPYAEHEARRYVLGEGETPPYGEGIAVGLKGERTGPYSNEEFVFKGHCAIPVLSWPSPKELKLSCGYMEAVALNQPEARGVRFILDGKHIDRQ